MLREHMPELVPVYERLCELAGGGDIEARMLSMWRPPSYLSGCSQGVWTRGEPVLVRNYDYSPDRIEGTILGTAWEGRRVIGMSDCLWGLLDGVNDAGLAVSLAFGGRRVVGRGFGVPLVVRYLLQVCETVADARTVLARLPYHLAHTLTLVDRSGAYVTAYLSPDRGAVLREVGVATNHQGDVEWLEHARLTRSLERERRILATLDEASDPRSFAASFLRGRRSSRRTTRPVSGRCTRRSTGPCPDRPSSAGPACGGSTRSAGSRRAAARSACRRRPPPDGRPGREPLPDPRARYRTTRSARCLPAAATSSSSESSPAARRRLRASGSSESVTSGSCSSRARRSSATKRALDLYSAPATMS